MLDPIITSREVFSPRGLGFPRAFPVATPAAGAEISLTVPSRVLWRILGFQATFTASAGIATRTMNLRLQKNGGVFFSTPGATTITASQVATLIATTAGFEGTSALLNDFVPLPTDCFLSELMQLVTVTTNIQVADQYSAATVWVMEWVEV